MNSPSTVLLSRYELVARAEDRGLGESWAARDHQQLGRPVGVKFLAPLSRGDVLPEALSAALDALRVFRHPLCPSLLDRGVWQSRAFIVHDPIAGESIGTRLDRARRGQQFEDLSFLRAVFDAVAALLDAAHRAPVKLLHGALTPGSVIVDARADGSLGVQVLDLALAPWTAPPTDGPAHGAQLLVDPAPERFQGGATTERTDVYALGALLSEFMAQPPSEGETIMPAGADHRRTDVPSGVWAEITRATSIDPSARHESVAALQWALAAAWKSASVPSTPMVSPPDPRAWNDSVIGSPIGMADSDNQATVVRPSAGPRADAGQMLARMRHQSVMSAGAGSHQAPLAQPTYDGTIIAPTPSAPPRASYGAPYASQAPPQQAAPEATVFAPAPAAAMQSGPLFPGHPSQNHGTSPPRSRSNVLLVVGGIAALGVIAAIVGAVAWSTGGAPASSATSAASATPAAPAGSEANAGAREYISQSCAEVTRLLGAQSQLAAPQQQEAWRAYGGRWVRWRVVLGDFQESSGHFRAQFRCDASAPSFDGHAFFEESNPVPVDPNASIELTGRLAEHGGPLGLSIQDAETVPSP